MDKRFLAILAALGGTTIYALNHTIAKDVMPTYVQGFGFIMIRLIGGTVLFWIVSLFVPKLHTHQQHCYYYHHTHFGLYFFDIYSQRKIDSSSNSGCLARIYGRIGAHYIQSTRTR